MAWFIIFIFQYAGKATGTQAGIIAGAVVTYPIKFLIDRHRPYEQLDSARLLTPFENDPSFPSEHTEMSFLAATIVSQFHPSYSKYLYAFSHIVALSRIYVGVHFPIDVIGGAIVGIVIGKFTLKSNLFKPE